MLADLFELSAVLIKYTVDSDRTILTVVFFDRFLRTDSRPKLNRLIKERLW